VLNVEQALRALVAEGVADGTLGPGAKLPTERALVERLAAPRGAIRRALDVMEREGLVVRQVGRGTFLTEEGRTAVKRAPTDTSPAEIIQARLLIEPPVTALAARHATQSDLERIARCVDGLGDALVDEDPDLLETWDQRLHRAIAHATHSGLLEHLCDVMHTARELPVWGSLKRRTHTIEHRRLYHRQHVAIVDALRDRNPELAESTMRTHLESVARNLLGKP
jgi:DNA-binding FadR family transcriptional regulator